MTQGLEERQMGRVYVTAPSATLIPISLLENSETQAD